MTDERETELYPFGGTPTRAALDRDGDPSKLSGPPGRDVRRSYVEEQYPAYIRNNRPRPSDLRRLRQEALTLGSRPPISILVPVTEVEGLWLERALESVLVQSYPIWELLCVCRDDAEVSTKVLLSKYKRLDERIAVKHLEQVTRVAELSNAALSMATGEFACALGEADELSSDALLEVAKLLQECPEADMLYSDEDTIDAEGTRSKPRFKPGWSPDLLLSTNYVGRLIVYRRSLLEELGGFGGGFDGAEDHDLALRASERAGAIVHVPKILYHRREPTNTTEGRTRNGTRRALAEALERRGIEGSVEDGLLPRTFRVRPTIGGEPKVSIIIPSRDNASLLKNCVESIEGLTEYPNYEILIVDNDSTEPATLEYLAETPHRVIPFREEFNYSRINNFAVARARGEYVLLLNDDTEVIGGGWLGAMLEHAQRPEVGAVGARLLYPDGRVQHAGVLTGLGHLRSGVAAHAYQFYPPEAPGHLGTLLTTTDYSAVTAACVLMRKAVYEEVGGLDEENLPVSFNDVDLCLRVRERGYLVVYTPYAELYHYESVSRGYKRSAEEVLYMRERWGEVLDSDPHLNPNFSKGTGDFNLRADLLRPRVLRPEPRTDNPENPSESQLILMSPEKRKMFTGRRQKAARDSHMTTIVPKHEGKSAITAYLMGFVHGEDPGSRRAEQPRDGSPEPTNARKPKRPSV